MNHVWLPGAGHYAHFTHRDELRPKVPMRKMRFGATWPATSLPINWYGNLTFPMDGNDTYGCHDENTEVLTNQGWVLWPEYDGKALLGTMNPTSGMLEFQAPLDLQRYEHNGRMAYSDHNRLDFALTPDHRMLHKRYIIPKPYLPGSAGYGKYEFKTVDKLPTRCMLPGTTTGFIGTYLKTLKVGNRLWDGTDFLKLIALVLSDGWVSDSPSHLREVSFCCFREDRYDMVASFAHKLGIEQQPTRKGVWMIYDEVLSQWFKSNVFSGQDYYSPYKFVPDLVKVADSEQIEEFLKFFGDQTLHDGESRSFYSSSKRMIDDLQELMLRVGKRATIVNRGIRKGVINNVDGKIIQGKHDAYELHVPNSDEIVLQRLKRNPTIQYDQYKGEVFCATVPNSTLVTRRNGRILISGNCCGEAMAAHADNTFTGMNGNESTFDLTALENQYLQVSGGDNGLSEDMVVNQIWKPGIAGNTSAIIYDALDIDPTNQSVMQAAIQQFGGVCFALSVPDVWINNFQPNGSSIWDAPATANENQGHFIFLNGVDSNGNYHALTWGSYVTLTPAGVSVCEPSAFCVFSPRWFNPTTGVDPTGATYASKASVWVNVGGSALPPSPFVTPTPAPSPTNSPIPTTLELKVSQNPLTLTATVKPNTVIAGLPLPTGLVVVDIDNSATVQSLPVTNGVATLNLSQLTAGLHGIGAGYKGDINYSASPDTGVAVTVSSPTPTPTPVPVPVTIPGLTLTQILQVIDAVIEAGRPWSGLNVAARLEEDLKENLTRNWPPGAK